MSARFFQKLIKTEDYPKNLYLAIGIDEEDIKGIKNEDGLNEALNTLTERERTVIEMRFKDKMTLEEIGERLDRSGEIIRINQLRALRKLQKPNRRNIICNEPKELSDIPFTDTVKDNPEDSIYKLGLSVRAYNCLRRAGFDHLSDLQGINVETLAMIRNLGYRSLHEITKALRDRGVEVKGVDEFFEKVDTPDKYFPVVWELKKELKENEEQEIDR